MLTLPTIVERNPQFYIAVKDRVTFSEMKPAVDRAFPMLFGWIGRTGVQPAGAAFFRYNVIDMAGKLEIEFSVPVTERVEGEGDIIVGTLPSGRYGQISWTGPYDALLDVNAVLIGWAREKAFAGTWRKRRRAIGSPRGSRSTRTTRRRSKAHRT